MMMMTDSAPAVVGMSVTPTAASANASANRRPRAQSMHQFGEKSVLSASSAAVASARDCNTSGSFVSKLFRMVESEPSTIVSWIRGRCCWVYMCMMDGWGHGWLDGLRTTKPASRGGGVATLACRLLRFLPHCLPPGVCLRACV